MERRRSSWEDAVKTRGATWGVNVCICFPSSRFPKRNKVLEKTPNTKPSQH